MAGKDLSSMTATAECTINSEPSWYVKFLSYLKNHNRVAPGKLELPDCDFFIVAPRRTLRVLKPPLKSGGFYEASNDRPESVNDSFFARWSRRPHPSGNCRCSFRQSSRLSTTEEQIISAEINRIRTSLCEAERTGQDIEELEQRISVNLENLIPVTSEPKTESSVDEKLAAIARVGPVTRDEEIDGRIIKNKIVEDLERYINDLLEEILTDTIKFIAESESVVRKVNDCSMNVCVNPEHLNFCNSLEDVNEKDSIKKIDNEKLPEILEVDNNSFNNISFAFHGDADGISDKGKSKEEVRPEGYVNHAFLGSPNDPDSLDFYLHKPIRTNVNLEHLDCVDSGINSVETIEFQPDQEPSLEESLMEIIDAKLGRSPLRKSWEDLSADEKNSNEISETANNEESPKCESVKNAVDKDTSKYTETIHDEEVETEKQINKNTITQNESNKIDKIPERDNNSTNDPCTNESFNDLEATNDLSFDKLRLELQDARSSTEEVQLRNKNGISIFRKKFSFNESRRGREDSLKIKCTSDRRLRNSSKFQQVELDDYRKKWSEPEGSNLPIENQNPRDLVMFRKNRKPTIVFLHGFGSSAEVFNHQLEYFSNLGYPCIAPDMLGHGMSSAPDRSRDYHFEKLLRDLDTVLHHYAFKPGQKCVLVAHNYGCSFATALACKYDSNIHQLVLISGGGPTPLAPPSTENAGHCCLRTVFAPLLMCGLRREILYSARGRQHPYCGPENAEQCPSHMKYVLDGMVWPDGDYVFHRRICTPTLLIHGLRDKKVSLVQECQMERTMMKAFLEAIPAAGHCPMTDCPDQLNHMIHCFIDLWKNKKW